jgi:conjugal transfer/type IV secretion protein DotA/TraY
MLNEWGVSKKKVLAYTFLPEFLPRLRGLTAGGFSFIARLIAQVFYMVRILPRSHPYVQSKSNVRFGIRHVIAEAANHIVVSRKNIDQMIIFGAVLVGVILLALQFILVALALFSNPAFAQSRKYDEFFETPTLFGPFSPSHPEITTDLAFKFLNLVFGFKDIFGKPEKVTSFHEGLHTLFGFYSYGILLVGLMIVLYHVVTIVAETAKTGAPFGERFNHAWAPVRLIIFLGCLIPLGTNGINLGQWFTLNAAKLGSGVATQGWLKFNSELKEGTYVGSKEALVGTPNAPEIMYLPAFMMIAKTCSIAHKGMHGEDVDAYVTSEVGGTPQKMSDAGTAQDITAKTKGGQIFVAFGVTRKDEKGTETVDPVCGEIVVQSADIAEPGSAVMQHGYYSMIQDMWNGSYKIEEYARNYTINYLPEMYSTMMANAKELDDNYKKTTTLDLQKRLEILIGQAVTAQQNSGKWAVDQKTLDLGWGGAGIWYNKIAQMNGTMMTAVQYTPRVSRLPRVLEEVKKQKLAQDKSVASEDLCNPKLANGTPVNLMESKDNRVIQPVRKVCQFWTAEGFRGDALAAKTNLTGNIIIDSINLIFGTTGIFNLCKNADIHPLAQLSMAGKGLVENSIALFGVSAVSSVLSMFLGDYFQSAAIALGKFAVTIASIGLMAGFVLFYVVPFMPFIYFLFALGGWVKGIFEAMVGIPLWILAHLSLDGEGMMGDDAEGGYFLVFEIFIRPILIIFGLLGSIIIFAAMVKVLNEIFYLVISNMSGHDPMQTTACFKNPNANAANGAAAPGDFFRGSIDEFFYTIVYAIVVYMMGLSCFKLIDLIPNNILRWMGAGIKSFNDLSGDAAESLLSKVTMGGGLLGSQVGQAIGSVGGNAGKAIESVLKDD